MADSFVPAPYTELAVWLDVPDDVMPTDRAKLALESATAMIQEALDQRIVAVTGDVLTLIARPNQWQVWLPERPVNTVTTVKVDGVTKTVDVDYYLDGPSVVAKNQAFTASKTVEITYNHGYATIPQGVVRVCLALAAQLYENPAGLRQETVGSISWTVAGSAAGGAGLSESDVMAALSRYWIPATA
jgi:hypothetical protein